MQTAAIIVAAGQGTRAGSGEIPKQYQKVGGEAIISRSVRAFSDHDGIDTVQVVIGDAHGEHYENTVAAQDKLLSPVTGGATRQASVLRGLEALEAAVSPDRVLIHDAARPLVDAGLIQRVIDALDTHDAVLPVLPVVDTLRRIDGDGRIGDVVSREHLARAQTPQGFAFDAILSAHRRASGEDATYTDDAAVAAAAGLAVQAIDGSAANHKITTADDLAMTDRRLTLESAARLADVRTGFGFDVHALGTGTSVTLGGVEIEHNAGLIGHSDADVILHALTDAILGALGDGDIGVHFPPSDETWRGAASDQFLKFAAERVRSRGGVIAHLDATLVGEGPKLAPHRDRIRARIAEICAISIDRVGVKATTNEGLGFIGRHEGMAAHAVATIRLPSEPAS